MCSACLGNMHHGKWALISNKASPIKSSPLQSIPEKTSTLVKVCSECIRLKDKPCCVHRHSDPSGKYPNETDLRSGSCKQNGPVARSLTMQTSAAIEAGIFIHSPVSSVSSEKLDYSALPPSRCYLPSAAGSVASSGYGSDARRPSSCTSDRESVFSLSTNLDWEPPCPGDRFLAPKPGARLKDAGEAPTGSNGGLSTGSIHPRSDSQEQDCEGGRGSQAEAAHGADAQDGAQQCQEREVNSVVVAEGSGEGGAAAAAIEAVVSVSALPVKSAALVSVEGAGVPSKPSVGGLDSGLGLDSDPGYHQDTDAESGISEDMGSDDESHMDDLDPGPLATHTGPTARPGKKSTCVGSKVFLFLSVRHLLFKS